MATIGTTSRPSLRSARTDRRSSWLERAFTGGLNGCGNYSTVAYDSASGSVLWARQYDGAEHSCDDLAGVAIGGEGELVFVTGTAQESDAGDIVTIAYDAIDGSRVWLAREVRPLQGADTGADIVTSVDGSTVYVTGTVQTETDCDPCPYSVVVAAYDAATGARRWVDEQGTDGPTSKAAITVSSTGDVFVTGRSDSGQAETVAYDGATGLRRWVARSEEDYGPNAIVISSDGLTAFVAAYGADTRYSVIAYSAANGSELWRVDKGSAFFGSPYIAASPVGNTVYFTAESRDKILVVALEGGDGSAIWRTRYAGEGLGASPRAIATSDDGTDVLVTGNQGRHRSYISSYGTIVLDAADGDIRWSNAYGGHGYHFGSDIAAGPDGSVYVTGESDTPTFWSDFATIKYE